MKTKNKKQKKLKKKRLVNVMRNSNKRAPFLDSFGENRGIKGFGHSRG